ncbi:hypothetical protein [Tropicimonas sp. IMCC34011]|uniref:hypothetical protein n=1 Tax=Tropicimonas sp. IMCC34011 TaxID=2248759 RepID=UPI000E23BE23|nr:hypothetical protein [Tropicimonas sp. IMCC34011]
MRALLLLILLAACARPMTQNERAFIDSVHGAEVDTSRVRFHDGALIGGIVFERPPRPQLACRERIWPPEEGPSVEVSTAAFVLGSRMFVAKNYQRDDWLASYPETLPLPQAMLLAHELTHVWQWQARDVTGYNPLRAVGEQIEAEDPYLFDVAADRPFLDYPYEQQASIVEEYVCCRALDPEGARTARLSALLTPQFPGIADRERAGRIMIPYADAEIRGICS